MTVSDFASWREAARGLLHAGVPPEQALWTGAGEGSLFAAEVPTPAAAPAAAVPRAFLELAEWVSCHRDAGRWNWLYAALWRLTHGEPQLLDMTTDSLTRRLTHMAQATRRDSHKLKAFVRFRRLPGEEEAFVAWHEPSHLIVKQTAPFFARRFAAMNWAILTPDDSAYWNGALHFGPGVPRTQAPDVDGVEELWKTYYSNIFNPARVKISAMVAEMPKKYWHTMPETALLSNLLRDAPARVEQMVEAQRGLSTGGGVSLARGRPSRGGPAASGAAHSGDVPAAAPSGDPPDKSGETRHPRS